MLHMGHLIVRKIQSTPALKKRKIVCKYRHLEISKEKLKVFISFEKIKIWQASTGYYQIYEYRIHIIKNLLS